MLARWEEGFPIVAAVKTSSEESGLMYRIRTAYYNLVGRLTDVQVTFSTSPASAFTTAVWSRS